MTEPYLASCSPSVSHCLNCSFSLISPALPPPLPSPHVCSLKSKPTHHLSSKGRCQNRPVISPIQFIFHKSDLYFCGNQVFQVNFSEIYLERTARLSPVETCLLPICNQSGCNRACYLVNQPCY
jgi:hypothetical protein